MTTTPSQSHQNHYVESQAYKDELGGGRSMWNSRGEFQLYFLQKMGLLPDHDFLDIGCGPIRAGEYIIDYLNQNKYTGIDREYRYIYVSESIVKQSEKLKSKSPIFQNINSFKLDTNFFSKKFDFMFAFAVFKTTKAEEIFDLIQTLEPHINIGGKIIFTHLRHFIKNNFYLPKNLSLKFNSILFNNAKEMEFYYKGNIKNVKEWPFGNDARVIFPIMVLEKNNL